MAKPRRPAGKTAPRDSASAGVRRPPEQRRFTWAIVGIVLACVLAGGVAFFLASERAPGIGNVATHDSFVGSETCANCHPRETGLWRDSQHKHAMAHATEKTVLGDFSGVTFEYYGVRSRFFRRDNKFLVETDGPDGKLTTFEIKYTFGVTPLQQYLIEFPDGRVQALSIAWDSRPKENGGQRWFHLYPDEEIRHDDVLHWTKLNQNWNFMCAECHSTGVRKNYDATKDRFDTSWAEISVGCEACHGQGSRHVGWARNKLSWWPFGKIDDPTLGLLVRYTERSDVAWSLDPKTGNSTRSKPPAALRKEVESCGLCHARRAQLSEDWVPGRWLSNTHAVAPLSRGLYHADGQMRDEVYNYGSFKQSKMFAAGVTCSDCHDPHSAKLKYSGDNVCLQCHGSEKFSTVSHHRHADVTPPVTCASCHMPVRTYMQVDPRHDHSFRVPRPDISVQHGTPNACNDCHKDKSPAWAAAAIEGWHGPVRKGSPTYAPAFSAAWEGQQNATPLLATIAADGSAPAIVRASALSELNSLAASNAINLARAGLSNPDPMVRLAALDLLDNVAPLQAWPIVSPLLTDPVRGVRTRAALLLAAVPTARQPAADRERFDRAAEEFVAAQRLSADRPEGRSALAGFLAKRGQMADAETEYKAAIRLSPQFAPAAINLADLYRQLGREAEGERVLRTALIASPRDAGLHHALGLALVRLKQLDAAIAALRQATELEPDRARYAYVYAVALHSANRSTEAIDTLKQSAVRHPQDRDTIMALISFTSEAGQIEAALDYAEQLARAFPQDLDLNRLVEDLRRRSPKPAAP
jgi:predicted CXXCH cytochrome family protein